MKQHNRMLWLMLSLTLMILAAGCGSPSSNAASPPASSNPQPNPPTAIRPGATAPLQPTIPGPGSGTPASTPLDGSKWRLEGFGPKGAAQPVAGTIALTLEFLGGGRAGGNGGCNSFGGNYSLTGQTIKFSDIVSTMRACTDNALMDQESRYLKLLQATTTYTINGDRLVIEADGGQSVLNYVRA